MLYPSHACKLLKPLGVFNLRAKVGQYSKKGDPTFKCTPCILRNHLSCQNMRRKHDAEAPTSLCINDSPCAFHEITPPMASPVPGSATAAKVSITFISGPTIHLLAQLRISRASSIFYSSLTNSASIPARAASRIGPLTPINPASYHDCLDVFSNRGGTISPPCRTCVHDHKDGATPPSGPIYSLSEVEQLARPSRAVGRQPRKPRHSLFAVAVWRPYSYSSHQEEERLAPPRGRLPGSQSDYSEKGRFDSSHQNFYLTMRLQGGLRINDLDVGFLNFQSNLTMRLVIRYLIRNLTAVILSDCNQTCDLSDLSGRAPIEA